MASPLLNAVDVTFAYGDRAALRDVSLALSRGELVAVIGPNGSGKSTLIRALLGQHHATGAIEWDGRPIRDWQRRELARRVAYLPQSPTADADHTVAQTLRLGRAPYWHAFGIESTRDAEVVTRVAEMLELSPLLDRRLAELSGGQRQRVLVGRCLVQEPAALLLDEPNTFLDLRHQVDLLRLLCRLKREQNTAILMASHDLNLAASFADRMILLHEGVIVASGLPSDVMRADILSSTYGIKMRRIEVAESSIPLVFPDTLEG